jgi:DNA-binding PadR family transcriptional regulator
MGRRRHASRQIDELLQLLAAEPDRWRYGYELSAQSGVAVGTLYPALARLAEDGLLEHRWEVPPDTGRPRHVYRLTAAGVDFAAARRAAATSSASVGRPRLAAS